MLRKDAALWNMGGQKVKEINNKSTPQGRSGFSVKRAVTTQKWEGLYYIGAVMGGYKEGVPR